ncbi:MAG: ATP-binding protein, partial [Cyanobacteria bacterium J06560_5]
MSSNSPLSGALIRQSTEAVGNFLRWVAELIVSRNWFSLLILIAIASLFLFNPSSGFAFKAFVIDATTLKGYALGFWLGEAGLLLAALAIAVKTMPRVVPASKADTADRKAIKGLRPFDTDDAEIFAQLQRQRNLRECLESITSGPFRFGILHGESGCGKTSFLQAGVLPQLAVDSTQAGERAEGERRKGEWGKGERAVGVYVRFSDQEPVRTIATAIADQLEIPLSWLLPEGAGSTDLMAVLQKLADSAEQPLILLLDQFEQFFVHHKRKASRQDFIQSLAAWYKGDRASPIRIVVAVRSDLMYQLDEIHQALGYSLAPQEVFRLEKFTPAEASRVLEAIAQTEGLAFNREFVTELAQAELADREEGLISPVDLQILCWMIERQTADELRAFNRSAFEKFGGVEGLLLRFLERTLEARVTEGQRQAVVKVLLALTDLERQVRAGMLTAPELREKLKGSAKPEEVNEAVAWLVRGDVRLITPQQKEGEVAYELAHERLIPALMRQAGKELSAVDQANRLMDKRVNEWLGNHCDKRYFFGPRELWLLRQQQPYLVWGAKREQKEKLLRLSRRRVYGGFAALLAAVMISSSFVGWRNFTTSGQIWNIQSQLSGLLKETSSGAIVADAAVAYAKNGQWDKGLAIAQQRLRDKDRTTFVVKCSELVVRSTSIDKKSQFLSDLKVLILAIKDKRSKSDALSAIASAYVSLEDSVQAKAVLS